MTYWKPFKTPGSPLVSIVVAAFAPDARHRALLECLLKSLEAQTYPHWEAIVIHDGPSLWPPRITDTRVTLLETPQRKNDFGHSGRPAGIKAATGKYITLTNGDNYYCPVFLEAMVHMLIMKKGQLVYCDMVHSHKLWQPLKTTLKRKMVDLGCWMADAALVKATPWTDFTFSADWFFLEKLLKKVKRPLKVPTTLFVHN